MQDAAQMLDMPGTDAGAVDEDARPQRRHLPSRYGWRGDAVAALLFLATAVWVTLRLLAHPHTRIARSQTSDEVLMEWMLAHGARVVTHFENPLVTGQLGAPDGVNLMVNNAILGLAVPLAPVTLLFGPHIAFLVATVGCLAGTAYAWYHVLSRHFVSSRPAALLGAAVAGFGPGPVAHAGGQLNLIAGFLLPFIVWRTLNVTTRRGWWRNAVLLGLLVTWQVFLSEEPLFATALAIGLVLALYAAVRWSVVRPYVPLFLANLGVAAAVAGALLAYPLWYQFFGPHHVSGMMPYVTAFSMNLDAFARLPVLSLGGNPTLSGVLDGGPEQNGYIGVGLLVLLVFLAFHLHRDVRIRCCLLAAAVFAVLSLGPTITLDGRPLVPGPYRLLAGLPLFSSMVPSRLALTAVVLAAVALALALAGDRLTTDPNGAVTRSARPGWTAAFLAALLPLAPTPTPVFFAAPVPAFITDGTWRHYLDNGHTLLTFPVPTFVYPWGMRWAAATNCDIPLAGGYFITASSPTNRVAAFGPPDRFTTTLVNTVYGGAPLPTVTEQQRHQVYTDLRYWHTGLVAVIPGAHDRQLTALAEQLFGPGRLVDGVRIWQVDPSTDGTVG